MDALTYEDLVSACHAGGASVLTSVTELAPAAGPHAGIARPGTRGGGTEPTPTRRVSSTGGPRARLSSTARPASSIAWRMPSRWPSTRATPR